MKKIVSAALAVIMIFSSVCVKSNAVLMCDVNGDGNISSSDALEVLQYSVGIRNSFKVPAAADTDGDGLINSSDALHILFVSVGILDPITGRTIDEELEELKSKEWLDETDCPYGYRNIGVRDKNGEIYFNGGHGSRVILNRDIILNKGDTIDLSNCDFRFYGLVFSPEGSESQSYIAWRHFYTMGSNDKFEYPVKVRFSFSHAASSSVTAPMYVSDIRPFFSIIRADGTVEKFDGSTGAEKPVFSPDNYPTLNPGYVKLVQKNYSEFMSEVTKNDKLIPIVAFSDSHGGIKADCEVFKMLNDLADWGKISRVINLGDTIIGNSYDVSQLEAYNSAMKYVPLTKRLEIRGNHDGYQDGNTEYTEQFFKAENARRINNENCFAVDDERYNVKYVVGDMMSQSYGHNEDFLSAAQADFLIKELSSDTKDIVYISHVYLFKNGIINREGKTFNGAYNYIDGGAVEQSFKQMLQARKNKTSGVLIDSEGKTHSYNFTKCQGKLLLSLHGHQHSEGYKNEYGLTEFLLHSYGIDANNCFYFAYIDRENRKFKCWCNAENTKAWTLDIL